MPTSSSTVTKLIDIRVNYEKAITALGRIREDIENVQKAQRKLREESALGSTPEQARQAAALDQQLRVLKDDYRLVTRAAQNMVKVERTETGSLVELRAKLALLTRQFDTMSGAARKGAEGLKKMVEINKVTNEIKEAEKATQRFYRNVGNYTSALRGINEMTRGFRTLGGVIASAMGGLSAGRFVSEMTRVAREFEDAMARVRAVSNPLQGEFDALVDKARELGRTTRYTAGEVANGMELLARNGLSAQQSLEAINPTLQLAQANTVSIAEAAQISTNVMNGFGKSVYDLAHVNDVLSSACAHSATNLKELGEAMKVAAPIAKVANVSIEQTTAALGVLANVGMRGSDAGTGIKQMLMALTKADTMKKSAGILQKYNLEINETTIKTQGLLETLKKMKESGLGQSLTDIGTLVGKYAAPRMAALINNVDQMYKLTDVLQNSYGENARMFEQSLGTTSKAIYELKSAWESFMIDVFQSTSTYLVTPIKTITEALRFMGEQIGFFSQAITSLLLSFATAPLLKGIFAPVIAEFELVRANAMQSNAEIIAMKEETVRAEQLAIEKETAARTQYNQLRMELDKAAVEARIAMEEIAFDKISLLTEKELELKMMAAQKAADYKLQAETRALAAGKVLKEAEAAADIARAQTVATAQIQTISKTRAAFIAAGSAITAGVQKLFAGVVALGKALAPLLALTAIWEAVQAIGNAVERTRKLKENVEDINKAISKAQHNETITKLEIIKAKLHEVHDVQKQTNEQKRTENELISRANGLLGTQYKTYEEITKALGRMIYKLKQAAKIQALQNTYSESFKTMTSLAAEYGINETDPYKIYQKLQEQYQDQNWFTRKNQSFTGKFGANNLWSALEDKANLAIKNLQYVSKYLDDNDKMSALFDNGGFIEEGDFQPTDPYTPKNKDKNLRTSFDNMLKKYMDEFEKIAASNVVETYERQLAQAQAAYEKVKRDVDTTRNDKNKYSIYNRIMSSSKFTKTEKDMLKKVMSDVVIEAEKHYNLEAVKLRQKATENAISDEIELWKARIDVAKEKSEERYNLEKDMYEKENRLAQEQLYSRYLSGKFGDTKNLDPTEAMKEYNGKKKQLEGMRDSGTIDDEQYQNLIGSYEKDYEAAIQYFNLKQLLQERYYQEEKSRAEQHARDMAELQLNILKTQMQESETAYQEMLNDKIDHYLGMNGIDEDYWNELESIVGTRQSMQLRNQYDFAQAEYDANVAEKQRLIESGEATADKLLEIDGKINASKAEMVEVHKNANNELIEADKARLNAASKLTQSIISLTEAIGDEDKEATRLAKVLALADIAIKTGAAIASVIAQAFAKEGAYGAIEAAAGIAEVIGLMAQAVTTVKSANFAKGGKVTGAGTGTSDSISANLSNGEYVMTAKATKIFEPLLAVMNQIGAGVALPNNSYVTQNPSQMSDFQDAMAVAMAEVQPVVSVKEITRTQNRVKVIQNLGSI